MPSLNRLTSLLLVAAAIGVHANAGSITLGSQPDGGIGYPFGVTDMSTYQQVYNSTAFSTAELITGITFYRTDSLSNTFNGRNYSFYLSTTSQAVNGLNLTDPSANLGADNQLFFAWPQLTGQIGSAFTFTGFGFRYDPSKGNLLLTIVITGPANPSAGVGFDGRVGTSGGQFSRAMFDTNGINSYCGNCSNNYGLTTTFTTASLVPEPSSAILSGLGLAAVALGKRRRSAQ